MQTATGSFGTTIGSSTDRLLGRVALVLCLGAAACGSDDAGGTAVDRDSGATDVSGDGSGSAADVDLDLGVADAGGAADIGEPDAGGDDVGGIDTGGTDTGGTDTGGVDTGGTDTGSIDAGGTDTGGIDTGGTDTGGIDTGGTDTGGDDTGGTDLRWLGGPPTAAGPYAIERIDTEIELPSRTVTAEIHRPVDGADAPYPVVVFNHGFQLAGEDFRTYGERLASHGIVAILPTMGDSLISSLNHAQLRDIQIELDDWIVINATRRGSVIHDLVDPALLGVGGHSRGGKQSVLAAGADDRIAATLNVDPVDSGPPFGGSDPAQFPSAAPESARLLTIPSGYIGAGRSTETTLGQACAPAGENYAAFYSASPSPTWQWFLPRAGHNDFVVNCDFICSFACVEGDDPAAALDFAIATTVAFYKVYLAGDDTYASWLEGPAGWPAGTTLEHR